MSDAPEADRLGWPELIVWCLLGGGGVWVLFVGHRLHPDPGGMGTHQQLGLDPCTFLTATGAPCPTCGFTTAVSHLAHGDPVRSFLTQPFGFLIGIACALFPLGLVRVVWTRRSLFWPIVDRTTGMMMFALVSGLLTSWFYKWLVT